MRISTMEITARVKRTATPAARRGRRATSQAGTIEESTITEDTLAADMITAR